jgi:hypothetical protein
MQRGFVCCNSVLDRRRVQRYFMPADESSRGAAFRNPWSAEWEIS